MATRLAIKKTPYTQEYQVVWYEDGKRNEDKTSYHNDRQDAVDTMAYVQDKIDKGLWT